MNFLDMPEPVSGKVILHAEKKGNLLPDAGDFIFPGFCRYNLAVTLGKLSMVFPVFIQTGNLTPVFLPPLVRFPVKHVWIDTTDGKPLAVYPAHVVLQEPAGAAIIVPCFERIPGYIECTVLVAKLRERSRFNRFRIYFPCYYHITVEEEHVPVECPGAAPAAEITLEPDLLDNCCKPFRRVSKEFG